MRWLPVALVVFATGAAGCAPRGAAVDARTAELATETAAVAPADSAAVAAEITAAMQQQVAAWNAGDVRGFMDLYRRTRQTTFLSGGVVRQGWQETYAAYERSYPDRAAMGTLTFSDLVVRPLSPSAALVWGRWRLAREADTPGGLFTLLFERHGGAWRIVHDHTSSE